jgi:hypothetical protein
MSPDAAALLSTGLLNGKPEQGAGDEQQYIYI